MKYFIIFILLITAPLTHSADNTDYEQNGGALWFDRADDKVSFGNCSSANYVNSNVTFSISFWMYNNFIFGNISGMECALLSKNVNTVLVNDKGWMLTLRADVTSGQPATQVYLWFYMASDNSNHAVCASGNIMPYLNSQWHHYVITYSPLVSQYNLRFTLYVDGKYFSPFFNNTSSEMGSPAGTVGNIVNTSNFFISANNGIYWLYAGSIDNLCIFGEKLFESEISYLASHTIRGTMYDAKAIWNFDTFSSDGRIRDETGNGNHSINITGTTRVRNAHGIQR